MSTINSRHNYDDVVMPPQNSDLQEFSAVKVKVENETREQESKTSRSHENKISRKQENKNGRIVSDEKGLHRRPVNMTMCDDVKLALDILAARRRERTWKVLDAALRKYLHDEKVL